MYAAPSYEAPSSSAFNSEHGFSNWDIFNTFIAPDPWKYMEEMFSHIHHNKIFHQKLLKWVIRTMKQ